MSQEQLGSGESKLETAVSYVLIIGVLVSLALETAGIIFFYRSNGHLNISQDRSVYVQARDFFRFLGNLGAYGQERGTGILLMTLGIATLILTPYVRVIASALYFAWRLDYKFLLITGFVLVVLTVSLSVH